MVYNQLNNPKSGFLIKLGKTFIMDIIKDEKIKNVFFSKIKNE